MGNTRSTETNCEEDLWWTNGERRPMEEQEQTLMEPIIEFKEKFVTQNDQKKVMSEGATINYDREQRKKEMEEDFIKFKQELARKHERRRQLIAEKKKEMLDLRDELVKEKEENERLRRLLEEKRLIETDVGVDKSEKNETSSMTIDSIKEENEELRNEVEKLKLILKEKEIIVDKNKELRISLAEMQKELQSVNTQIISFEKERIDYQEHVTALKDIIRVTKEMLRVRESQIEELKKKITSIEELLASKEINILSDDLRKEYERQLRNIRDLRSLYEDRQRVDRREKENLRSQIEELKKNIEDEQNKNGELTERVNELEEDNSKKYDKIVNLESNLGLAAAECRELHAEMNIINQLFSQILISFNNDQDVDLDKMIKILEENHDLLTNIVINDESNETSALPKLLLDLINQVNGNKKDDNEAVDENGEEEIPQQDKIDKLETIPEEEESLLPGTHQLNSPEEIVENLPKVWRVLIELLSHQSPPNNEITEKKGENDSHCYKSVETPTGLRKVLSVSKTFIRLKSLILEKKALEKEMTRLKQLNTHLEGRLSDQEKRLVLVSNELSKTWNFVGKMQKQHQQLHTQEKILRYELAQKRKLLTELKEELEYCRQKWLQARKQNSSTEEQWKQLRTEFASRKRSIADDINNSVESGYSDDKSSSDEEDGDFDDKPRNSTEEPTEKLIGLPDNEKDQVAPIDSLNCEGEIQGECENLFVSPEKHKNSNSSNFENQNPKEESQVQQNETPVTNLDFKSDITKNENLPSSGYVSMTSDSTSSDVFHSLKAKKTDTNVEGAGKTLSENSEPLQNVIAKECEEIVVHTEANTCKNEYITVPDINNYGTNNIETSQRPIDDVDVLMSASLNTGKNSEQTQECSKIVVDSSVNFFDQCASRTLLSSESKDVQEKPSTSHKNPAEAAAEFVARREERMKRLEEQCNELYFSVAKTSLRGLVMSNKLDNLHEMYGDNSQTADDEEVSPETEDDDETTECQFKPVTDSPDDRSNDQE